MVTRLLDDQHIRRRPTDRGVRDRGGASSARRKVLHARPQTVLAEHFGERVRTAVRVGLLVTAIAALITGLVLVGGEVAGTAALASAVVGDEVERAAIAGPGQWAQLDGPSAEVVFERTEDTEYIVSEGETLSAIADRFNLSYELLAGYNDMDDPHALMPDQRLLIPSVDEITDQTTGDS
jgi:LysM repeat protein